MSGRLQEMPSDEAMAKMSREDLTELRDQIGGDAMDVIARMKLLAELALDKLPDTTDEDGSRYALELLLDQFRLEFDDSNRTFRLFDALLARIPETVSVAA